MIRTRDLVLYVLIFVFIVSGIAFTIAHDKTSMAGKAYDLVALRIVSSEGEPEVASESGIDRSANIAKLREKIEQGDGLIGAGEPVFTSVDTPEPEEDLSSLFVEDTETNRIEQYCNSVYPSAIVIQHWPQASVSFQVEAGIRQVIHEIITEKVMGSSTVQETSEKILLQLPVGAFPSGVRCLDSELIGVALDGSLIKNNETWRFRSSSPDTLIGYARDGVPIFGPGVEDTELDQCGGYVSATGYRYHVRPDESFIIGCYMGVPAQFTL